MMTNLTKQLFVGLTRAEIDEARETGEHVSTIENGGTIRLLPSDFLGGTVAIESVLDDTRLKEKLKAFKDLGVYAIVDNFPDVDLYADLERLRSPGEYGRNITLVTSQELGTPNAIFTTPSNNSRVTYQSIRIDVSGS